MTASRESREAPPNLRSLTTRIENLSRDRGRQVKRIQRTIANTVVGQMLPPGVVKGGTAMKIRVGRGSLSGREQTQSHQFAQVVSDLIVRNDAPFRGVVIYSRCVRDPDDWALEWR